MNHRVITVVASCLALTAPAFSQGFRSAPAHAQAGAPTSNFGISLATGNFDRSLVFPAPLSNPVDYAIGDVSWVGTVFGRVTVFDGSSGAVLNTFNGPPRIPTCPAMGFVAADFGASLTGVGDVDGDLQDDFVTGAPLSPANPFATCATPADLNAGAAFLLSSTGTITLIPNPAIGTVLHFGIDVCGLDDWTGDGVRDFAVGSLSDTVFIYNGATRAVFATLSFTSAAQLGRHLAAGPDIDLDGRSDLLLGSNGGEFGVVLNSAPPTLFTFTAAASVGASLAPCGDLDGNTLPDIALGDPAANSGAGGLQIFDLASMFGGTPHLLLGGGLAGDALGTSVALVGDVDASGTPELLVGGGAGSNLVRMIDTGTGATLWDVRMTTMTGPFEFANATDLPLRTDLADLTDGFAEVVLSSRNSQASEVLHGGPRALATRFGGFCGSDQIKVELLGAGGTGPGLPVLGTTQQVGVRAAAGGEFGFLFLGLSFPAGIPFAGCTVFIDFISMAPLIANSFVTTQTDTLTPANFPANLAGLGDASVTPRVPQFSITYQMMTIDGSGNPLSFSEALMLDLGW